jgi:hypothetical protein
MTDTSTTSTGGGDVVTPAAIDRLNGQAASQTESSKAQLASYGFVQSSPTTQEAHPSAQRLASPQWAGKTSTLNAAQAAQDNADVWVTVPVDRVITAGGSSKTAPVYSSTKGYVARPGESAGSIPPTPAAGKPY